MRKRLVAVAALAALALPAAATADVRVKSVDTSAYPQISVTVVGDGNTSRPPALFENGKRARGVDALNLAAGKSVVLAIDRSQSMAGQAIADASAAARAFVAAKSNRDRIAVVAVGYKAVALTRFSSATIDADIALRTIAIDRRYGTALYDAVVLSAEALATEDRAGRVLILVTDGQEVSSNASLADAIAAAKRAGVVVHPIGIESAKFSPAPLQRLARETGGSYHAAASTRTLSSVYAAIARELRQTWRLEYATAARPGDRLRLEAKFAGGAAAASEVVVPATGTATGDDGLLPASFYESTIGSLFIALLAGALVFVALGFARKAKRGSWLRGRLAPHVEKYAVAKTGKDKQQRLAAAAELFQATERSFGHLRIWKKLECKLERADMPLRTVEFVYVSVFAALVVGLFAAVFGLPAIVILLFFALGGLVPYVVVGIKARRRLKQFDEQLPDLLMTMAASLKAGHSFKQGINSVVEEGQPPASKEFKRVLTEMQLGRPMDDALADMATRIGSKNLDFVLTAVTIQRQVGGSLSGLFDMVADTVRERQQFARRVKGLTAMGRGSAYILVGLPFALAGVLSIVNPVYMAPLFNTSAGKYMIGFIVVSMAIGAAMLKKIVSFKV